MMYKLIIMDINMPSLDGVETTKIIREQLEQQEGSFLIPFIVAHTAIREDQFGNFREKGFDAYLEKPLKNEKLKEILHELRLI